jgi:MFS family permease
MRSTVRENVAFIRNNGRWLTAGFLLTFLSSFGQTLFIGLSGNDIRAAHGLSGGEFGSLYMVATLGSALTLPWLGRTLDLMPGWKVVRFTMPALAFACILLALAPNVAVLVAALYLLRLFGQGMMTETALTEVGRWFVASRGRAIALIVQGLQLGSAILPPTVVLIHRATGDWRFGWFASAALLLLMLPWVIALSRVPRVPQAQEIRDMAARTARDWTRAEVLRDPIFYLLLAGTLAPPFIGTVIFFHQGYLIALRGYDPLAFAAAFPVMAVTTVVFGLISGHLIDRFGSLRLLPYVLIPLAAASLAVALVTPLWGIYVFMALLGVSNGFVGTIFGALWPEVYGTANLGGIRAITVSAMVFATAAGPGITGWLIDAGFDLPAQMLWMAIWCVAACFILATAARRVRVREGR